MFERIIIDLDDQMLPGAIYIRVRHDDGHELSVTVSPDVEAKVLAALRRDLAESIADAIDHRHRPGDPRAREGERRDREP